MVLGDFVNWILVELYRCNRHANTMERVRNTSTTYDVPEARPCYYR